MSKLRTYAYMNKRSQKVKKQDQEFKAVYEEVRERSEGRCEYTARIELLTPSDPFRPLLRCTHRAVDMHHLYKPRRSHTEKSMLVHLCRHHHERAEYPYKRGRLVISLVGGRHTYRIVFAADKFALRAEA